MTHLMGRNGLLSRRGVKRDALRIGQAPPGVPSGTREAISPHRRPHCFARPPRCGPLVVGGHHGPRESQRRAQRADKGTRSNGSLSTTFGMSQADRRVGATSLEVGIGYSQTLQDFAFQGFHGLGIAPVFMVVAE